MSEHICKSCGHVVMRGATRLTEKPEVLVRCDWKHNYRCRNLDPRWGGFCKRPEAECEHHANKVIGG